MKNVLSAKKWLISLLALVLAALMLLSGLAFLVDPFFQFRVRDNSYMLNPRFVNPGLIKNYDYDCLLIGSSMSQNFDMDLFRSELGVSPLHVSLGGINDRETIELMNLADSVGKAEQIYVCLDLHSFTSESSSSTNPAYLMKDDLLSNLKYLLSYELWFRFLPVDIAFLLLQSLGIELPGKFQKSTSIDHLANWEDDFDYGADIVLKNFSSQAYSVSEVNTEGLYERMKSNIDELLAAAGNCSAQVIFYFPPYSSLYWYNASEYIETYLDIKDYFILQAFEEGFEIYDFQHSEICAQLDYYKDSTHYSGGINDYMTLCFASGEYLTSPASMSENRQRLYDNIDLLISRYSLPRP